MVGSVYEVRPDWRVPGLVRRRTAVSRHEPRRQERSGRSRSVSRPTPRQPLEQTARAHPSRPPSQSQHHRRQFRYPSLPLAPPYDEQYAHEDDSTSEDDELPENPYVSAQEDSRGPRRNPVAASSAAPRPQPYCPPTVATISTVSGHEQGSERAGDGSRDHRGAAPEALLRDRERGSHGHGGSQRGGGMGSNAGIQHHRHPRSPQTLGLSSRQRPPPAEPITPAPAPAPQPGLHDRLSTTGSSTHYEHRDSGMAPPRHAHAHANNNVPGLQHGEGIARAGYAGHLATEPPRPPRPSPSLPRPNREPSRSRAAPAPPLASRNPVSSDRNGPYSMMNGRSGIEREGRQERERVGDDEKGRRADRLEAEMLAAEMGSEQGYQASMADRRRSIRKGGIHEMAGEEGLSAARPRSNPDPVAYPLPHTSGISSRQRAPPPPPYHTRPRSILPQQQRPAHLAAAASRHPPPHPPSSEAPRPHIYRDIPTASNARDSLFGFSHRKQRDDSGEDEGDRRADGLESTVRNPYLHPANRRRESLNEGYDVRLGEEGLTSSLNAHLQLSSGERRRPPAPPPPNLSGRSGSRSRHLPGMPQQQRQRPTHSAAAAPPASDSSPSSTSSSSAVPRSRNPAASSRGNANTNSKVPNIGPRGERIGVANTGPEPGSRPGPKREGTESVDGYGYRSTRGRDRAEVPRPPPTKTGERATPQQQRRPAYPAVAYPPASDTSDCSMSSSPVVTGSRNLPATPRGNANANASSTGPRGGRVGTATTGPGPEPRPGPKREGVKNVSGYGSVRKGAGLAELPPIKPQDRALPQQQRRPAHPAAAPPPPPPASHIRNRPPTSSIAPQSPHVPVYTNRTNTSPRAGGVGVRSAGPGPRSAPIPGPRRPDVRNVSGGRTVATNFPNPSSPRRAASSRWEDHPRSAGHRRAGKTTSGRGKIREEETNPTLTQKIGHKLWVSALSCM